MNILLSNTRESTTILLLPEHAQCQSQRRWVVELELQGKCPFGELSPTPAWSFPKTQLSLSHLHTYKNPLPIKTTPYSHWFRNQVWTETCLKSAGVPSEGSGHFCVSPLGKSHNCCSSSYGMYSFCTVKESKPHAEPDHGSLRSWELQVDRDVCHSKWPSSNTHKCRDTYNTQGGPQG